jgi:hypothetical protein
MIGAHPTSKKHVAVLLGDALVLLATQSPLTGLLAYKHRSSSEGTVSDYFRCTGYAYPQSADDNMLEAVRSMKHDARKRWQLQQLEWYKALQPYRGCRTRSKLRLLHH